MGCKLFFNDEIYLFINHWKFVFSPFSPATSLSLPPVLYLSLHDKNNIHKAMIYKS